MTAEGSIECRNKFLVSCKADGDISIGLVPYGYITPSDALLLAAWLVVLAEPLAVNKFEDVLKAVQS